MNFKYLLDSSALLAYLHRERGADIVAKILDESAITTVNLSEVLTKLVLGGVTAQQAQDTVRSLEVTVLPFDESLAMEGADLCGLARSHGLSLGDRACLAAARRRKVTAVTTDQAWKIAGLNVNVRVIR